MYERTSDAQHEAVCNVLQYSDPSLLQSGSSTSTAPLSPPRTHDSCPTMASFSSHACTKVYNN